MAGGTAGGDGTWAAVHTLLTKACQPCHTSGMSGGHSMGQSDLAKAYEDSQKPSGVCAGKTKGACAAERVASGSMPLGAPLPDADKKAFVDAFDAWLTAGQPAP